MKHSIFTFHVSALFYPEGCSSLIRTVWSDRARSMTFL